MQLDTFFLIQALCLQHRLEWLEDCAAFPSSITGTFSVDSATGNLVAYNFVDGNFTYTPANSNVTSSFLGSDVLYYIQTPYCTGAGTTCADLVLPFLFAPNFSALTFQPTGSSLGDAAACFETQVGGPSPSNCMGQLGTGNGSDSAFASGSATGVPEPSSVFLLVTGLLGLPLLRLPHADRC